MRPPKCRLCGHEHALGASHVFSGESSRVTSEAVAKKAEWSAPVVKPVKPPSAEPGRSNAKTWRERDPEAYRKYMREYMARRRAARRVSA